MSNFIIKEVIARGGDDISGKPDWYNPNSFSKIVKVTNPNTGKTIYVDITKTKGLNLKGLSDSERLAVLERYASADSIESDPASYFNVPSKEEDITKAADKNEDTFQFLQKTGLAQDRRIEMPKSMQQQVGVPTIQAEFRLVDVPAKFIGYYHGVVLTAPYIILVFDTRAVGYQQFELDAGARVFMTIRQKDLNNIPCLATGLTFEYDQQRFSVFLVDRTEEEPKVERFSKEHLQAEEEEIPTEVDMNSFNFEEPQM